MQLTLVELADAVLRVLQKVAEADLSCYRTLRSGLGRSFRVLVCVLLRVLVDGIEHFPRSGVSAFRSVFLRSGTGKCGDVPRISRVLAAPRSVLCSCVLRGLRSTEHSVL